MLADPPDEEEIQSKWGSFTLKVKADKKGRRWTIDYLTRVENTRVDKSDLAEFRKFQEEIQAAFHVEVTLKALDDS
jgi:hypothetical protein